MLYRAWIVALLLLSSGTVGARGGAVYWSGSYHGSAGAPLPLVFAGFLAVGYLLWLTLNRCHLWWRSSVVVAQRFLSRVKRFFR